MTSPSGSWVVAEPNMSRNSVNVTNLVGRERLIGWGYGSHPGEICQAGGMG